MLLITAALFSCAVHICWRVHQALITLLENNTVVAEQNPAVSFSFCRSAAQTHIFFGEFLEAILTVKTPTGEDFLEAKWQLHYCGFKRQEI